MKISGFKLVSLVVCILGFYIGMKTYIIRNDNYINKRIYAIESQVEYKAKRCYIESYCHDIVTIDDLYKKGYIKSEIVNPINGNLLNKNTLIKYINNSIEIDWNELEKPLNK